MLFNSITFAVFLLTAFILYHIVPARFRWVFLLAASYAFYTPPTAFCSSFPRLLPIFLLWGWKKHRITRRKISACLAASCPLWVSF